MGLIQGVGTYSRGGGLFKGWGLIHGVGTYSRGPYWEMGVYIEAAKYLAKTNFLLHYAAG